MIKNEKYRVRYKLPRQQKEREMIAVFLDEHYHDYVFIGRPAFGTATLPKKSIVDATQVDNKVPCALPRMLS